MMRYTCAIEGSAFTTKDRALFTAHLLTLDDWGKGDVLMAYWDSIGIEDCYGGTPSAASLWTSSGMAVSCTSCGWTTLSETWRSWSSATGIP